jgi:hypothetical protein
LLTRLGEEVVEAGKECGGFAAGGEVGGVVIAKGLDAGSASFPSAAGRGLRCHECDCALLNCLTADWRKECHFAAKYQEGFW